MNKEFTPIYVYTSEKEIKEVEHLKAFSYQIANEIKKAWELFDEKPFTNEILQSIYMNYGNELIEKRSKAIDEYIESQIEDIRPALIQQIIPAFNKKCNKFKDGLNRAFGTMYYDQKYKLCKYENDKFIIDESKVQPMLNSAKKYITNQFDKDLYDVLTNISDILKSKESVIKEYKSVFSLSKLMEYINNDTLEVERFSGVKDGIDAYVKYKNRK